MTADGFTPATVAMPMPLRHRGVPGRRPGRSLSNVGDVAAEIGAADEHVRQVPDVFGTDRASSSVATPGRTCCDVDDQGVDGLVEPSPWSDEARPRGVGCESSRVAVPG